MRRHRKRRATGETMAAWVPLAVLLTVSATWLPLAGLIGLRTSGLTPSDEGPPRVLQGSSLSTPTQGMRVYMDTETGDLLEGPPSGQAEEMIGAARARPREPLEVVPSPVLAGGMMIKLDDRFRAEFTATVDPDGQVCTECVDSHRSRGE